MSGYAQEAFSEKDDKENIVATLDLAISQEKNIDHIFSDKIRDNIIKYKEKDQLISDDFLITSLPKNSALEQIMLRGDLYNNLSPIAKSELDILETTYKITEVNNYIVLDDTEKRIELEKEFEKVKNKQSSKEFQEFLKDYLDLLEMVRIARNGLITTLELEKDYLSGSLTLEEYNKEIKESRKMFQGYFENLQKGKFKDYLDSVELKDEGYFVYIDFIFTYVGEGHPYKPNVQERLIDMYRELKLNIEYKLKYDF